MMLFGERSLPVCVHVQSHMCPCTVTCISIYRDTYRHFYLCACVYIYTCICIYTYIYIYAYIYIHICMYILICIFHISHSLPSIPVPRCRVPFLEQKSPLNYIHTRTHTHRLYGPQHTATHCQTLQHTMQPTTKGSNQLQIYIYTHISTPFSATSHAGDEGPGQSECREGEEWRCLESTRETVRESK